MKILGGDLTETGKSWVRMIVFSFITVIALVTAILSSFMRTKSGTKEHNWWIFLMVIAWVAFGSTAAATGLSIVAHRKLPRPKINGYVSIPTTTATTTPAAPAA